MDIHKPKAAHSWREFLIEIGTITCGILIALGLEQVVEQLHWRHAVEEARAALRGEIADQASYFDMRVQIAPCLDNHIQEVDRLIERSARERRKPQASNVSILLGNRLGSNEWAAERSAQTLVHFPADERREMSTFYSLTEDVIPWRDEEGRVWDELALLDGPARPITDAEITALRYAVIRARHLASLMQFNSQNQVRRAHRIGVAHWDPHPSLAQKRARACTHVQVGPE